MKIILDQITICTSHGIPLCFYGNDLFDGQRIVICQALKKLFSTRIFSHDLADECLRTIANMLTTAPLDPSNTEMHIHLIIK
jgi:hypothetical protein